MSDIPVINPTQIITSVLQWFWNLATSLFQEFFGHIRFSILWEWLPQDIQAACSALLIVFFALVIWRLIKGLLPFV